MRKSSAFRLQPLLDDRRALEDACRHAAAIRARAYAETQQTLGTLGEAIRSASERPDRGAHLQFLGRSIEAQARVAAERRTALDEAHQALVGAGRARKAIEMLKDRHRAAVLAEKRRLEQLELDDANAHRGLRDARSFRR